MFSPAWPSLDTSLHVPWSPQEKCTTAWARSTSLPLVSPILLNTVSEAYQDTTRRKETLDVVAMGTLFELHAQECHCFFLPATRLFGRLLCPVDGRSVQVLHHLFNQLSAIITLSHFSHIRLICQKRSACTAGYFTVGTLGQVVQQLKFSTAALSHYMGQQPPNSSPLLTNPWLLDLDSLGWWWGGCGTAGRRLSSMLYAVERKSCPSYR